MGILPPAPRVASPTGGGGDRGPQRPPGSRLPVPARHACRRLDIPQRACGGRDGGGSAVPAPGLHAGHNHPVASRAAQHVRHEKKKGRSRAGGNNGDTRPRGEAWRGLPKGRAPRRADTITRPRSASPAPPRARSITRTGPDRTNGTRQGKGQTWLGSGFGCFGRQGTRRGACGVRLLLPAGHPLARSRRAW